MKNWLAERKECPLCRFSLEMYELEWKSSLIWYDCFYVNEFNHIVIWIQILLSVCVFGHSNNESLGGRRKGFLLSTEEVQTNVLLWQRSPFLADPRHLLELSSLHHFYRRHLCRCGSSYPFLSQQFKRCRVKAPVGKSLHSGLDFHELDMVPNSLHESWYR